MSIGQNIQRLRLQHGLSQNELASIAGVTNKAVSAWENDRIVPRMGPIQRMADYFGIKKSDIIESEAALEIATFDSLNKEEAELVSNYRGLDDEDKRLVFGIASRLKGNGGEHDYPRGL